MTRSIRAKRRSSSLSSRPEDSQLEPKNRVGDFFTKKLLSTRTLPLQVVDCIRDNGGTSSKSASGRPVRFDYGYDVMNRRTFEQRDTQKGDVYSYDPVDQVAGVKYDTTNPNSTATGADRSVSYSYDATGNRTSVADSIGGTTQYSTNNLNQYTTVGGATLGYDLNGNLGSGNNGIFLYDAQNRALTASVGTNTDQFSYDSKNRVVEREVNTTITYLIYDGWDLIEERGATGNVLATYVHGVRQDEILSKTTSTSTIYYHHNALGSVTDLTNASGVVVEKYKYDAFGKPTITDGLGNPLTASAQGNRFMFTGREYLEEVNLYDYRNRMYSADLGRFLQTDPLRFSAGDVNVYRYCGNDPVNCGDPWGLRAVPPCTEGPLQKGDWWSNTPTPQSPPPTPQPSPFDPTHGPVAPSTPSPGGSAAVTLSGKLSIDTDGMKTQNGNNDPHNQPTTSGTMGPNGNIVPAGSNSTPLNTNTNSFAVAPQALGPAPYGNGTLAVGDTAVVTVTNPDGSTASTTTQIGDFGQQKNGVANFSPEVSVNAAQQLGVGIGSASNGQPVPQINGSNADIPASVTFYPGTAHR